jgi:16S rRNA (cytosine1402-N4)-methyltransferase
VFEHVTVLAREATELLNPGPGKRFLDGTVGGGGHSEALLLASAPDGQVIGLDRDEEALAAARQRLQRFTSRFVAYQTSFADAAAVLDTVGWHKVDGVILDLGISSHQVDTPERGFSFRTQGRLDMRMDRRQELDAEHIVNEHSAAELERIFRDFGEEAQARRIAQAIVRERTARPIETTEALADLVRRVKTGRRRDHDPATQVFQALRIAVNQELTELERFLETGYGLLRPQGRMSIISFHSLEDRLVKVAFRKWNRSCLCPPRAMVCRCGWSQKARLLTKKPLTPSTREIETNPRARSAKLRVVERV